MHPDGRGPAGRTTLSARVLQVADQFLLLRIDGDDGLRGRLEPLDLLVDIPELGIAVTAGGGASHLLPGRSRREKYVNRAANWIYLSARRGGNLRPAGGRRVEEPPAGGPVWEPAGGAGYSLSSGAPCTSRGCR